MHPYRTFVFTLLLVLLATLTVPQSSSARSARHKVKADSAAPAPQAEAHFSPAPTYMPGVNDAPADAIPPSLAGAAPGPVDPEGLTGEIAVGADGNMKVNDICRLPVRKQKPESIPVVPVLLLGTLASSVAIWGVRVITAKKKAPLWVVGTIAGALVMVVGLSWSGLTDLCHKSTDLLVMRH